MANKNLTNNIMKLRKQKGLSQERLARLSDVANNIQLLKWNQGKMIILRLKLCERLPKRWMFLLMS